VNAKLNMQKGFTLVELLVSIAIVVVLAGALLVSINPLAMLQKGRDARRLEDIDALAKAINLAIADNEIILGDSSSCTTCDSISGTQAVDGTGFVQFTIPTGKTGLAKYLPALPIDQTNTNNLMFTFASSVTAFELNAVLESVDNATKMTTDGGNDPASYEIGTSLVLLSP